MTTPSTTRRLLFCLLSGIVVFGTLITGYILLWGRIDFSIAGSRLRIGHPNEAVLIILVAGSLYLRLRYGLSLREQLQRLSDFLTRRQSLLPVVLVCLAFLYLARIKLMQHFTFHTGAYDLAMYDTAVRNTLHGKFMFAEQLGRNFFSEHFSPVLLLLCPLYLLADTPVMALLAECFVVAMGLWFIYRIGRHYSLSVVVCSLASLVFLNYKYLARGVMFDFHPEMMLPTFLLGCVYSLLKRRWWLYIGFLLLALSCKEDVAIYAFCLGVYAFCSRETRYAGLMTCVSSLIWAFVAWCVIIPGAMPHEAEVSHFVSARWGHLGDGYLEVAVTLLKRPLYVASRVFSEAPMEMLVLLLFVPLIGFEILLLALPGLILNTTTTFDMQSSLQVHYAAPIVPFVFWAFIVGLARLERYTCHIALFRRWPERWRSVCLAVLILLAAVTFGADFEFHSWTSHISSRYRVMRQVEPGSTVSCETGFVPHLSRHARPYLFPAEANHAIHYRDCDFILVDRDGNPWPLQKTELEPAIDEVIRQSETYEVIAAESGVYLFANLKERRKAEQSPAHLQNDPRGRVSF
jgi:uncharacterized membrane protein